MKKIALCIALIGLLGLGGSAIAEIGTIDDVPAATLLLPYFEVDLGNLDNPTDTGTTTLFSVNNASASAVVAHVTFWTDESIPTLDFDIYLTGYDVQTINIRDIFNGILPRTADAGLDPGDTISPNPGPATNAPVDISFPGNTGPCQQPYNAFPTATLTSTFITHLRRAHTGRSSPLFNNLCSGAPYGDNVARGYVTVDVVNSCNLSFPSDPGYSTTLIEFDNVLWGDYAYVNPTENFAQGETLVHVEACVPGNGYIGFVGNGAGYCPLDATLGDYTFYGRYSTVAGNDAREPLATTFATRFVNGGAFDGGTDLLVWRDSKTIPSPGSPNDPFTCGSSTGWFPLGQTDVVAFDEMENSTDLCFRGDNISPQTGGADSCFPLETQRIHVEGGNVIADDLGVPYEFGWLFINLNHSLAAGDPYPGVAQAWITTVMDAQGRFSIGYDAIQLDNALQTVPGGVLIDP
jgi:hypothetical protein